MESYAARFSGIQRLYGKEGARRLKKAHVCVVGVGGVGSWTVEALARSGLGHLTMIDLDDVCITNVNRQIPAHTGTFGHPKVEVLHQRVLAIQPDCQVRAVRAFFTGQTAAELLQPDFDYVIDAIDQVTHKCLLIAQCRERSLPILTTGGAGGRRNPAALEITDLSRSHHDPLLQEVRKRLRQEFGFPRDPRQLFHVPSVFSTEAPVYPQSDGTVCSEREAGSDLRLDCRSGFGTASFVTGAFGFAAAARVVSDLAGGAEDPIP